jgi:decaprenylphospho-beta-D-erythro-pentofuranosid-2-ulose 2-reductase
MRDGLGNVQSVLLLGGTSEIGQAIVRRLLVTDGGGRPGRRAVLAARTPEACAAFADELRAAGVSVETLRFDADDTPAHAAVLDLAAAGGDLDVVLLAWGLLGEGGAGDGQDTPGAVQLARTNYVGVVSAGLEAARVLRRQGHGTVVYLSSVAGERVRKANFVYGSTKAGADAFMQGLADSLVGSGVDVLVVRPGFVRTKMTAGMDAAPFATDADTVAEVTARGLRRGTTTVWAPAALHPVFVVMRHLPRPVWRRMPR